MDNAAAESFKSTLKAEFVHRHRFTTHAEARIKIATWIADFYITTRRHSANDGIAPIAFDAGSAREVKAEFRVLYRRVNATAVKRGSEPEHGQNAPAGPAPPGF